MKYRKLRIAFSGTCGIACVLLVVLWVRSYWWWDDLVMQFHDSFYIQLGSSPGTGGIVVSTDTRGTAWKLFSMPHDDPRLRYTASIFPPSSPLWGEFGQKFANFGGTLHGSIIFPYWFAISVIAIVATGPWVRWRFSLRALLIATTLVAVALGAIVALPR